MATAGIRVLLIGDPKFDLPSDYHVRRLDHVSNVLTEIATFRPDVIVTSCVVPGLLKSAHFDVRKRWIHVEPGTESQTVVNSIETCYSFLLWSKHPEEDKNALISVYTGTFNTGDYLFDTYRSLKEQTYTNWEWVVVDDASEDGTWERLVEFSKHDIRVKPFRRGKNCGKIGGQKDAATRLCSGVYLVELDHDDMLAETALEEVKKAFEEHPDVGMVYSNSCNFFEDGTFHRFEDPFWKGRYRETEYRGRKYLECVNPDIYDRFGPDFRQQFGWFLTVGPNHLRAFRASTFRELGGYNPNLPVADDWDLYVRFFMRSKCYHIDKMLYFYRFLDNWGNTTFRRNKSIQDHLELGRKRYALECKEFNERRLKKEGKGERSKYGLEDISYVVLEGVESPLTIRCLRSIRRYSPGSEVILVENGVTPRRDLEGLVDAMVHWEDNVRFAGGCNLGAFRATRKVLCFMNNDAEFVDEDTPRRLVGAIEGRWAVVGPYSNRAKPPQGDLDKPLDHDVETETVVGVCLFIPALLFRRLGGFDPGLYTWEDDDLCRRVRDLGFGCKVVGKTYVVHERHATIRALGEDVERVLRENEVLFRRKHPKVRVIAISKNEERGIKDFFRQFGRVTRDWCLLDTGSTDGTVEIAKSMGVRVERGEFRDFAQARNEAIRRFGEGADWILMLDPDERLDLHTLEYLKESLAVVEEDILLAPLRAVYPNSEVREFVPKVFAFRNRPEIRWVFKVHEKLVGSLKQGLVWNGVIEHVIALHEDGRRKEMAGFYEGLQKQEPYFTDAEYRRRMREEWPILDYDKVDDLRIRKIYVGPKCSVIIPTYRRPELLKKAVESALRQDYVNLEVVIVGDACPDLDVEEYRRVPRVRAYNLSRNHGMGGAVPRNHGIVMAAGHLIAYLDDDNRWLESHVSGIYEEMRKKSAYWGFSSMQANGKDLEFTEPKLQGIDTSCVVHLKDLVRKYGWWKSREEVGYAHDWEFFERFVRGGEPWVCTRKPTLVYYVETSGQGEYLAARMEGK